MHTDCRWTTLFFIQQAIRDFIGDLTRGNRVRNRSRQLFLTASFFEIRAITTNSDCSVQPINRQRAGLTRINVPVPQLHLLIQTLTAVVKLTQIRQTLCRSCRDIVQHLLHLRRKPQIHQTRKVVFQQSSNRHCRKCRNQLIPILPHITAIHNRAQNAGIRAGTTDAL